MAPQKQITHILAVWLHEASADLRHAMLAPNAVLYKEARLRIDFCAHTLATMNEHGWELSHITDQIDELWYQFFHEHQADSKYAGCPL